MSINIEIHGKGPPLVLFHGWGFDLHVWTPLLSDLTKQYQLYLVDLPGFGLSHPMEWDVFKTTLLRQLPDKFALAGWSIGGLYATKLATEEKSRVSHLINIASSPRFIRESGWPGVERDVFNVFYSNLTNNHQQTVKQFVELQLRGQSELPVILGHIPDLLGLQAGLDMLLNLDLRQELAQLNIPVCYMFGRLDAIIPRRTMMALQLVYPHFNYILFAKSAHVPFLSDPDVFIAALGDFLL